MARRNRSWLAVPAIALGLAVSSAAAAAEGGPIVYAAPIKVCADPNNLPYSDKAGEGFENKLAEMLAGALHTTVSYTWFPQRRGFLRHTLDAGECDIVMGIPAVNGVLTTRSYYRSDYVFVSQADRNFTFSSIKAPQLRTLKVGVHLIGDDAAGTPPAVVLGKQGIVDNVVGFPIYGDYRKPSPPGDIVKAVARGDIDIAAVWGPIGGYFAQKSKVPLKVVPITDTADFLPQSFQYSIAMGVRPDDKDLQVRLNGFIASHRKQIASLLASYGVPTL